MTEIKGPETEVAKQVHEEKYRGRGETFKDCIVRMSDVTSDDHPHFLMVKDVTGNQRFLPAGRIQTGAGSPKIVTLFNCFVMNTIPDSMEGIMDTVKNASLTMKMGGGVGYDFSTIRPRGADIKTLDSQSCGVLPFMDVFNSACRCVISAGSRRGAQMAVLRVDHPDIEEYITAKNNEDELRYFNTSVAVTNKFMGAVCSDDDFDLEFEGKVYRTVNARLLWDKIMRSTWDWAEPGVLFIDHINDKNNLHYCETIAATNPCGEQPLPPYGACLLGSFNLVKYIKDNGKDRFFNYELLEHDIPTVVRMMDNIIDVSTYPLPEQEVEAKNKRRMGLGVTGLANAAEALGFPYGSKEMLDFTERVMKTLRNKAYRASIELAKEKGPFPLFSEEILDSGFYKTLPEDIREDVKKFGIRNSHLLSIAPTGTISLCADNVSSGIEPVFSYTTERTILMEGEPKVLDVEDYGVRVFGVKGKKTSEVTIEEHVNVLTTVSKYVDSACSKTCNVSSEVPWEDFKDVYVKAWLGKASGITTYRTDGKRGAILVEKKESDEVKEGSACYIDFETGLRECE